MTEPPVSRPWHTDPETLNDVVDDRAELDALIDGLRVQLTAPEDETAELLALGDLTDLLRIRGDLDEAAGLADRAVTRADIAGTAAQQHLARLRRVAGRAAAGEEQQTELAELTSAVGEYGPVIAGLTHQQAGRYFFSHDEFDTAMGHFRVALQLREGLGLDEAAESRHALDLAGRYAGEERRSREQWQREHGR